MQFTQKRFSSHAAGLLGFAAMCAVATASVSSSSVSSSGISGYSGKNSNSTCTSCHGGGATPTVTLTGPVYVLQHTQRDYTLTVSGGQQIEGGLDVATDVGVLVATDSTTKIKSLEVTHRSPKSVDSNGNVAWGFGMTAPAAPATVKLWGDGLSTDADGGTSGDDSATATMSVTVVDNLVRFVPYGQGLAGTGGLVPVLAGTDGPSIGPWSMQISNGLGGAFGLIWYGFAPDDISPFFGGHFYIDLSGPFGRLPIVLSGPTGVAGAGSLALNGIDVSAYAPLTMYFQVTLLDAAAVKSVSLSNALELHIEK